MKQTATLRIIIDVLILISVVQGWWFFALPLVVFGAWRFSYFIELIIAGITYDSLFGFVPGMGFQAYAATFCSILIYTTITWLKKVARK